MCVGVCVNDAGDGMCIGGKEVDCVCIPCAHVSCVRACLCVCVRTRMRACVRACVLCVCVCVCVLETRPVTLPVGFSGLNSEREERRNLEPKRCLKGRLISFFVTVSADDQLPTGVQVRARTSVCVCACVMRVRVRVCMCVYVCV